MKQMQGVPREVLATNPFCGKMLREAGFTDADDFTSLAELTLLPFARRQELVEDQMAHPPFGSNLTYPLESYIRLHQTSGTVGRPMRWLDTRNAQECIPRRERVDLP